MSGYFWSNRWSERPWWSKTTDIINFTLTGVILLIMAWEAARRWLGY